MVKRTARWGRRRTWAPLSRLRLPAAELLEVFGSDLDVLDVLEDVDDEILELVEGEPDRGGDQRQAILGLLHGGAGANIHLSRPVPARSKPRGARRVRAARRR